MSLEHPTFTFVPDFTQAPRFGIATTHDRTGLGQARQTVLFPQRRPDYIFAHRFAITTALEIQQLKEFFRERGGRAHPFFLPSWRRDLTMIDTPTEGTKRITISSPGEDYEQTHLTDTDLDHYGRYVYVWKDGEPVFVERVIRVIPGVLEGQEILDLDTELPFDTDENTWIGWAHLVRFAEDRIEWQHWSTSAAEAEIVFRAVRHANQNELTVEIEQLDQYGQLGFVECTVAPGELEPPTTRVAYAYGPITLHNSQDDPYYLQWAVWPTSDGIRIRKTPDPVWIPATGGTLSILFDEEVVTDHLALAFDQNAYEVIAYQKETDTIEVRRYFNTEVVLAEFEGRDPLLQYNGLLDQDLETGDTDVVCYYIKAGINALWMRFQRDDFEVEYLAALLPGRPIALKRAYFEYNEDESAGTLKVEFLDAGYRIGVLSSAAYPDPPPPPVFPYVLTSQGDNATATGAITDGDYFVAVIWADGGGELDTHPAFADGAAASGSLAGDYEGVVVYADGAELDEEHLPFEESATAEGSLAGEHVVQAISPEETLADTGSIDSVTVEGEYTLHVIFPPVADENAQTQASLAGVYEPA